MIDIDKPPSQSNLVEFMEDFFRMGLDLTVEINYVTKILLTEGKVELVPYYFGQFFPYYHNRRDFTYILPVISKVSLLVKAVYQFILTSPRKFQKKRNLFTKVQALVQIITISKFHAFPSHILC